MAVYLGSFNDAAIDAPWHSTRSPPNLRLRPAPDPWPPRLRRLPLSGGLRASGHEVGGAPLFGSRPSLALNSNLHSNLPDNLVQVVLHGIAKPVSSDLGICRPSRTA